MAHPYRIKLTLALQPSYRLDELNQQFSSNFFSHWLQKTYAAILF